VLATMYEADLDVDLISRGAPRWCCTATRPAEGWTAPGFSTAGWSEVPRPPAGSFVAMERSHYPLREARERGQPMFALETDELWLRVSFTAPEARPAGGAP
jgi:hypothetical protein